VGVGQARKPAFGSVIRSGVDNDHQRDCACGIRQSARNHRNKKHYFRLRRGNTNTRQIDSILRSDPYTQSVFRGVFARDKSPQKFGWPAALVWNLDTSKNPDSRWVAVYIDPSGRGYYFDSYDLPSLYKKFENFLNRNCVWWNFNRATLQAPFSTVCGQHCVYFLVYMCRGEPMRAIVSRFSRDVVENCCCAVCVFSLSLSINRHGITFVDR